MRPARTLAAALSLLLAVSARAADEAPPLGFTAASAAKQREVEAALLALPSPERCESQHAELTRAPHVAGTDGSRRVAELVASRMREAGLETEVVSYDVLLSSPRRVEVALVAPRAVALGRPEAALAEDPGSREPSLALPWHAYAKSGTLTADVVYVNHGRAEDYDTLARLGIDVRGKIALARYFGGYRGGKSLEAEKRGVAALITYSDPAEDGYVQATSSQGTLGSGEPLPARGQRLRRLIVPGDPLTPGWASGRARRIPESESTILPKIPSLPSRSRTRARSCRRSAVRSAPSSPGRGAGLSRITSGPVRPGCASPSTSRAKCARSAT
jgi:N-acetylated-alpha-linked acidic dipeptidase